MDELNFKDILTVIYRKKISIIVIMLISVIIGSVYSFQYTTPCYKSNASVILGKVSSAVNGEVLNKDITISESDLNLNSSLILTYSELVRSRSIMDKVSKRLKYIVSADTLMECVTVTRVGSSDLLQVTAVHEDPIIAKNIVSEVVDVFSEYVKEIYKIDNVYTIDEPAVSYEPYNINHIRDIICAISIGFVVSLVYVYVYSFLDNTVKSSKDIEELLKVKTLINIPFDKNKKEELITINDSKSIISEAFKTLRTNIQFSNVDLKGAQTLLVTSCLPSEGKSYVSANLAIAFAQAGKKVILVDSDMRRGRQSKVFKIPNANGLSNYISNIDSNGMEINWNLGEYIKKTKINNLNIITAGSVPPNPAELLASARLNELIESLKNYYDIIIFDGAPILPITDSLLLGRVLEKVMLVAENNKTKKDNLVKAKNNIEDVGGKVIGIALNKVAISNRKYGDEYYYYYSEKEDEINFKEKIVAFANKKVEKTKAWCENLLKKTKSLKRRLSSAKTPEEITLAEHQKTEFLNQKEDKKRNIAVELKEKAKTVVETAKAHREEKRRQAEARKLEEKKIQEERAKQQAEKEKQAKLEAEAKAKRDAEIAQMHLEEKKRQEEKAKQHAEARMLEEKKRQEEKAKQQAEKVKQAKIAAEERERQAKIEAEERAKEDAIMAEEKAKREEEELKRKEAERIERAKIAEYKAKERAKKRAEWNKKVNVFKGKALSKKDEFVEEIKFKKEEYSKRYNEYKRIKAEENKAKAAEKAKRNAEIAKIRELEKKRRDAERKREQAERAKKEAEMAKIREAEKQKLAAEKAKRDAELARVREEERQKRELEKIRLAEEKLRKEEEAKYTEEYLVENLYPKTKYNKF